MSSDPLFSPFKKQQEFIDAALSGKFRYLCYGGAIRGGKTFVTLGLVIVLARVFPRSRWAVVRKDLPTIRRNLLPSFGKIAPRPFCGDINMSDFTVRCTNGSEIIFFAESISTDRELNRWRGLEVNGFLLEEANELSEDTFHKAIERAGSWKVEGTDQQPPVLVLLTCNPSQGWVKRLFFDPFASGKLSAPYHYISASIVDNPYLSDEYKCSLESLPAHLYRKFVKGDWNVQDDPFQVVPYEDLYKRLIESPGLFELQGIESLGVDVAEQGEDATVLVHFRGPVLYEVTTIRGKRTDEIASIVRVRISERQIDPFRVGIDAIGVGAGVWGDLQGAGLKVRRIIAGSKPLETSVQDPSNAYQLQFRNLKSQMWWAFRQAVCDAESDLRLINRQSLVQDLLSMRYRIASERLIECESKDETRRRLGHSPDEGDAAVMANWVRLNRELEAAEVSVEPKEVRRVSELMRDSTEEKTWLGQRRRIW